MPLLAYLAIAVPLSLAVGLWWAWIKHERFIRNLTMPPKPQQMPTPEPTPTPPPRPGNP